MTPPAALPSSTGARHRTHTALINQYSLGMRSIGCSSTHLLLKLLLIYGSVFVSSSLRLPPTVHVNLPWGNLSLLPPRLLPCSGLLSSQSLIHSTVPGATVLWAVLIWYTVNRLLQQTLLHKPLPFYGFVLVFLCSSSSSSSYPYSSPLSSSSSSPLSSSSSPLSSSSSSFFSLLLSRRLPPRMHIKLPWGHLSMAAGLAEGN